MFKRLLRRITYLINACILILFNPLEFSKLVGKLDLSYQIRFYLLGNNDPDLKKFLGYVTQLATSRKIWGEVKNYSSDFQDFFVLFHIESIKSNVSDFFFIDIGAYNGITKSNTKLLEERGMQGLLIEPQESLYADLASNRTNSIINSALVSDRNKSINWTKKGTGQDFSLSYSDNSNPYTGSIITVSEFLEKFNFLVHQKKLYISLDIEGMDLELLKELFRLGLRPEIISIEHNHDHYIKKELHKLAGEMQYKVCFGNFFRNEFVLTRQQKSAQGVK